MTSNLPGDLAWKLTNLNPSSCGSVSLTQEEWDYVRRHFVDNVPPIKSTGPKRINLTSDPDFTLELDNVVWNAAGEPISGYVLNGNWFWEVRGELEVSMDYHRNIVYSWAKREPKWEVVAPPPMSLKQLTNGWEDDDIPF